MSASPSGAEDFKAVFQTFCDSLMVEANQFRQTLHQEHRQNIGVQTLLEQRLNDLTRRVDNLQEDISGKEGLQVEMRLVQREVCGFKRTFTYLASILAVLVSALIIAVVSESMRTRDLVRQGLQDHPASPAADVQKKQR